MFIYSDDEIELKCKSKIGIDWSRNNPFNEFDEFRAMSSIYSEVQSKHGYLDRRYNIESITLLCINCKLMYEYMESNDQGFDNEYGDWHDTVFNKLLNALNNVVNHDNLDERAKKELKRNKLESTFHY